MKAQRSNPLFANFLRGSTLATAIVVTLTGLATQPAAVAANQTYQDANVLNTWNTTDANWDAGVVWTNNNSAIFGGTGEAVTVGTVDANAITFNSTGYVLGSGTITLGAATTPVTANASATINSIIAFGTNTLSTAGTGTLTLGGANTGTGPINVTAGTLKLGVATSLGTSSLVTVSSGATLDVAGLATGRPVAISGTGVSGNALYNSSTTTGASVGSLKLNDDATIASAVPGADTSKMVGTGTLDLNGRKLTIGGGAISSTLANITSGDIAINSGGTLYYTNGGSLTSVSGAITVNTGGVLDTRDSNSTTMTGTVHSIVLNGGKLGNGVSVGNNGGGGGAVLKNDVIVNDVPGNTFAAVSSGFGLSIRLAGSLSGSGALAVQNNGSEFRGNVSGYTGTLTSTSTKAIIFNGAADQTFNGILAGTGAVTKSGTFATTLTKANTYTGATTVSAGTLVLSGNNTSTSGTTTVSSGTTLKLDYSDPVNGSFRKIPSGILTLAGGTIELSGGSYTDSVASTTLTSGTFSTITQTNGGTSVLNLGTVTPGTGTINLLQSGVAKVSNSNGASGVLPSWITVASGLSSKDVNGFVVAYTGYTPVTRWGAGAATILDGSTTNVQIEEGTGSPFDILLGSNPTTIGSLTQSNVGGTSAAVLNPAGQTLATNSILVGSGAGSLTIGNGTNNGTLKSAGTSLEFRDLANAGIIVNSAIADGTGASSLTKYEGGTLTLNGVNTYTGATTLGSGTFRIGGAGQLGGGSYSGAISNAGTFYYSSSANQTLSGAMSGGGSLTKDTSTSSVLTLSTQKTYTGGTTISAGVLDLTGGGGTGGVIRGTATVNATGTLRLSTGDATGYNTDATRLSTINLAGGTLHVSTTSNQTLGSATINMTGGAITGIASSNLDFFAGTSALNTLASATTSTISGTKINLRQTNGVTFTVADGAASPDLSVSSVISNSAGFTSNNLTKAGAGSMELSAANTFNTIAVVSAGTLALNHVNALQNATLDTGTSGSQQVTFTLAGNNAYNLGGLQGADALAIGANTISVGANAASTTYSGVLSGTDGSLAKTGAGTLTLSGANTYTGITTVSGGTIKIGHKNALGAFLTGRPVTQVVVASGAAVDFNGIADATYGYTIAGTGVGGTGALVNNSATAIGTGSAQTSNIKLSAAATIGGIGNWCLLTNSYAATTLDLGGFTLTKSGAGTFTLANTTATAGAITVSGGVLATFNTAPNLSAAALTLNNTAGVSLAPATALSIGSLAGGGTTGGGITLAGNTLTLGALNTNTSYAGVIAGTGTGSAIVKVGNGTQAFSGANTYTGTTTVSGGVLALDYTTQNNSKLSDTTALIFGGVSGLSLNNGSHTEIVSATTLNAGANVTISRPSGSALLQMNAITRNAGALLNFTSSGIATTDTLNNSSGILGGWATVGNDFATNSANAADGLITAYTGYADVTRLESGTKAIADATDSNVRIVEGTGSTLANITLAAATTNINTLLQSGVGGTSAATVALPSSTLRLGVAGSVMASSDSGALSIGSAVGEGTLTAGGSATDIAGDISVITSSANDLTINSVIANNGTGVVTLNKQGAGTAILAGANSYTGITTVSAGTLEVKAKSGDVPYVVGRGATLKIGYSTGGNYANTAMTVSGDGVSALTGFQLAGGKKYNVSGGFVVNDGPTTIRQYGSGMASFGIYDINSNPGLSITAAASGSVVDSNIQFISDGFGMVVTTAPGANTAFGDLVMNGPLNVGSLGLYKRGSGSLVLNAAGLSGNAALQIQGGTVICGIANCIGNNAALPISAGAKLVLNGFNQTVTNFSGAGIVTGGSATAATLTVNDNAANTFSGTLGGASANDKNLALTKTGTSVLTLSGTANSYTGATTVTGGTLRVTNASGSATGTGSVSVGSAGTVDGSGIISGTVSVSSGGGTIAAGNAGVGNLTVGALTFDGVANVNILPGTNMVNVTNALTASGSANSVSINIGNLPLATGVHHLISHSGAILGTGFGAFKVGTNPGGPYTYTLVDNAGYLDLQVTTSAIFWKGNLSTEWNTTDQNWQVSGSPVFFANTNAVVFDDTADTKDVSLSTVDVSPGTVLFSNSLTNDYTLSGSKAITGATSLTKSGTGYVTITNVNSFTGEVIINQGTLDVDSIANSGSDSALGAGSSIILGGGRLAYWGGDSSSDRSVTINSASTVETGISSLTLTGVVSGTGALTKIGSANLVLTNATNSLSGAININVGAISVDDIAKLGTSSIATAASGTLIVNPAATAAWSRAVTGAGTLRKQAAGTLNISTAGNGILPNKIEVESGTLQISSGSFSGDRMNGSGLATIYPGATLVLASAHSLGGDNNGMGESLAVSGTLTVNGEQYISLMTLDGGTVNGTNEIRVPSSGSYLVSGSAPSTVSAKVNHFFSNATWNVSDVTGDPAADLIVSGQMYNGYGFIKTGDGTMRLTAINTYTGTTTVNAGTLELADNARLTFAIPGSGSSNKITGAGTAALDGDFAINTAAAAALTGGTWTLEDVTASTYGSSFTVMDPDGTLWTPVGIDKWTKSAAGGKTWTFNEVTGTLTLTTGGYDSWADSFTWPFGADKTRTGDPDNDGFANLQEFLFGTDPTANTGSLASTEQSGADLIIRWNQLATGATYRLLESATIANPWTESSEVPFSEGPENSGYIPRRADVTIVPGKNFFRVEGTEAP